MPLHSDIASRLTTVRDRIARAAEGARRDPQAIRLVAVSKTFDMDHVLAAAAAGQREFGENRVQEALQKMAVPAEVEITWHLIGHLQANKARKAASFHWIHSVDSASLLDRIDAAGVEAGTRPRLLIQVDLAGEATKHGATIDSLPGIFERASQCTAARVQGLMLLPPYFDDPEAVRPYFRRLREIQQTLIDSGVPPAQVGELSMGMSHDFEVAIQEGSTIVRVGTAIFGARG